MFCFRLHCRALNIYLGKLGNVEEEKDDSEEFLTGFFSRPSHSNETDKDNGNNGDDGNNGHDGNGNDNDDSNSGPGGDDDDNGDSNDNGDGSGDGNDSDGEDGAEYLMITSRRPKTLPSS